MQYARDLIKGILGELEAIHSADARPDIPRPGQDFPRLISAGDRGSIVINEQIEQQIIQLARFLKENTQNVEKRFTQKEWNENVRRELGAVLANVRLGEERDAAASDLYSELKEKIDSARSWQLADREYSFGCTLFTTNDLDSFSFGPVLFEQKEHWIRRQGGDSGLSPTAIRRVLRSWGGEKLKPRKSSWDKGLEDAAERVASSCLFVCSVKTSGLAQGAGEEKALLSARLALTLISLFWSSPSQVLEEMNLVRDRLPMLQRNYTRVSNKRILFSSRWRNRSFRKLMNNADWQSDLASWESILPVWGELFRFNTDFVTESPRRNLMTTFTHALFWFHEACRSDMPQISTAYFGSCLDALSGGGKTHGVVGMLEKVLGRSCDQLLFDGGPTLREAVNKIYSDARSQMFHGTSPKFHDDWTNVRLYAEQLARLALLHCFEWAAKDATNINLKQIYK